MVFIAGADTVIVKGRWQAPDGTPATGTVELSLDLPTSDAAINVSYTKAVKKYTLDNNGEISVPFIITTDSSLVRPVALNVKENFDGASSNKWQTTVQDHGGGIFYLAKASPIEPRPLNQYVLLGAFNTALAEAQVNTTNAIAAAGTVAATGNTVARRDSSGRAQFASPAAANDAANKTYVDAADALKAPLASPTLTGTPTAPTATAGDNSTRVATTAFVTTADNLKAPLASPTLTGTPTAPTPATTTNTTQLATTAFAQAAINAGTAPLETPLASGYYYGADYSSVGAGAPSGGAGQLSGGFMVVGKATTLTRIGINIATAGSTGAVVRLGLYSFVPDTNTATRLVDAGTVDATTTGYKEITISQAVTAGQIILLAAVVQGAPTTVPAISKGNGPSVLVGTTSGSIAATNGLPGVAVNSITGALPSPITTLSAVGDVARVVVRA